jgi:hypothetical protein
MKNQELELTEGLFTIEAEERLETIQMATDVAESCCLDGLFADAQVQG